MRTLPIAAVLLCCLPAWAQHEWTNDFGKENNVVYQHHRPAPTGSPPPASQWFNPAWGPFYHGVASGDPDSNRVLIWTRLTPDSLTTEDLTIDWTVATDPELTEVVQQGSATTDATVDYTLRVDVDGLAAGTTYYYGFVHNGHPSLTGRTRTTPTGTQAEHLKFAVVSCANYQAGYFNAYRRLAERNDLDAVVHLGDYIYEYANAQLANAAVLDNRPLEPTEEVVSLADYRTRYSTYRLDTNLIRLHQQHPILAVWDDHETANNSNTQGAANHQPASEGPWTERVGNAKRAWLEWMPARLTEDEPLYRSVRYGDLAELLLLDTRIEGRDPQINDVNSPVLQDTARQLLGPAQLQWLTERLTQSDARWKLIGQQVVFSEFNIGWASLLLPTLAYDEFESAYLDIWDGYPAERNRVLDVLEENTLDNVVLLTGDIHSGFAFDVPRRAVEVLFQDTAGLGVVPVFTPGDYDAATGAGSLAVEFVGNSVTSANFDETAGFATSLSAQFNTPLVSSMGIDLGNPNPHMKYVNLVDHGYFLVDVRPDSVQADWFHVPILEVSPAETFATAYLTDVGTNRLRPGAAPSSPKPVQELPAPLEPPFLTDLRTPASPLVLLSAYPNPARERQSVHFVLNEGAYVRLELLDLGGRRVRTALDRRLAAGIYSVVAELNGLAAGTYFWRATVDDRVRTWSLVVP